MKKKTTRPYGLLVKRFSVYLSACTDKAVRRYCAEQGMSLSTFAGRAFQLFLATRDPVIPDHVSVVPTKRGIKVVPRWGNKVGGA